MRKAWFFLLLAFMALMSCGSREKVPKPEVLLTEAQMVDLLADAYLVEADLNTRKTRGENVQSLQGAYYAQIFEHYGITDSIFDQNMNYYSHDLVTLERIMDSVHQRFEKAKQ